jgi:hypothetical protein
VSISYGGEQPDKESKTNSLADAVMMAMDGEMSMIYEIGTDWMSEEFDHIKREAKFTKRGSGGEWLEKIVKF